MFPAWELSEGAQSRWGHCNPATLLCKSLSPGSLFYSGNDTWQRSDSRASGWLVGKNPEELQTGLSFPGSFKQQPYDHPSGMSSDKVKHGLKPVFNVIWGLLSIPKSSSGQKDIFPLPPNLHSSCFTHFNDRRGEWPFANITHSLELDQANSGSTALTWPGP